MRTGILRLVSAVIACWLLLQGEVYASPALHWQAPESCPSQERFVSELTQVLDGPLESMPGESQVWVVLRGADRSWRLSVKHQPEIGSSPLERVIVGEGTCAEFVSAATVTVALALAGEDLPPLSTSSNTKKSEALWDATRSPARSLSAPAQAAVAEARVNNPSIVDTVSPSRIVTPEDSPAATVLSPRRSSLDLRLTGLVLADGAAPNALRPGARLSVGAFSEGLGAYLAFRLSQRQMATAETEADVSAALQWLGADVGGCAQQRRGSFEVGLCLAVSLDRVKADPRRVRGAVAKDAYAFSAGAELSTSFWLTRSLALSAQLGPYAGLFQRRFTVFEDTEVYRTPSLFLRGGVGLVYQSL